MEQVINRRSVLGSVLAVGAAGAAGFFGSESRVAAAGAAPKTGPDELSGIIVDEVHQGIREMVAHPGPGARRFAGALRTYAAHGRARGLDQGIAKYYRDLIATEGRDAVLIAEPDWAYIRAEARKLGVDDITPTPVDMAARGRALDAALAGKYTAFLDVVAKDCDTRSRRMDERNVQGLRPIFDRDGPCILTMEMENWASTFSKFACASSLVIWGDVPVCAASTGAWIGVWVVNQVNGCHS